MTGPFDIPGRAFDIADIGLNFFGALLHPLGEISDLVGNDRKAPAVFAGTCSFNGSVQSEQVGLISDLANGLSNTADSADLRNQSLGSVAALGNGFSQPL